MKAAREFLVGYGSMSDSVKKPDGHKTFIVVDDYTGGPIWDEMILTHGLKEDIEGVTLLNVMYPLALGGGLWQKGGIVCPAYEVLPVVFCIEHGKQVGSYITNASAEEASDFVKGCK